MSDENLPDLFERVTGPGYAGATAHAIAVIEDLPMALIETLRRTGEVDVERGLPFPDEADDRPTWCGVVKDGNGRKAVRTAGTDLLLDDDVWAAREDRLSAPKAGWQVNLMDGGSVEDERATALLAQHGHGPYMTARNMHDRTGETTARDPELVRRWLERYGNGSIEELALGVRKGWQYHADRREIREQKLTPAVLRIIREDRATRPEIAKALGCHHDTIYQIAPLPRKAVKVRPLPTVDAVECGYVRTIKARALAYAKFGLSVAAEWEGSPGGWLGSRRLPSPKPLENGDLQEDDTI